MEIKYQHMSAGGNPTAIIYGKYSHGQKEKINRKIFETNKLVEQIGYIYNKNNKPYFEMMGNEFSGNGCRAAGYSLLKGKNGKVIFNTSGTNKVIIGVIKNKNSSISIHYSFNKNKMLKNNFGFLIKMFGSYIFVIKKKGSFKKAKVIADQYQDQKAVGIMFIEEISENTIKLNPYFYVKETKTLINETACGSGSIVVGIYESWLNQKSFRNLKIIQPSGESIYITNKYTNGEISNIKISGITKLLGNYQINIP